MKHKRPVVLLIALALCVAAFGGVAFAEGDVADEENLEINSISLDGDVLLVDVTNKVTGAKSRLEIDVEEYAGNSEYITFRAVDLEGNKSESVKIKNPFYTEETALASPAFPTGGGDDAAPTPTPTPNPFTPDGQGEVVDDITAAPSEKEFFTVTTDAGNIFYLIIDRERDADNVYFLNKVTESDLMALAEAGDGTTPTVTATPEPPATPTPTPEAPATPEPTTGEETTPAPTPPAEKKGDGSTIFIIIVVLAVGVVAYYVKIYRPKHSRRTGDDDDDFNEPTDDDDDDESEDEE
jgi:hypothetical protein